jgi:hypothetical protein
LGRKAASAHLFSGIAASAARCGAIADAYPTPPPTPGDRIAVGDRHSIRQPPIPSSRAWKPLISGIGAMAWSIPRRGHSADLEAGRRA